MAHKAREAETSAYVRKYEPPEPKSESRQNLHFGETNIQRCAVEDSILTTPSAYAKLLFPFSLISDSFGLLSLERFSFEKI